jgi:opacity protein-like surface antigen
MWPIGNSFGEIRAVLRPLIDFEESALHASSNLGLRAISMGKKHLLMAVAAGAMVLGMASAQAADLEPVAAPAEWYVSLFGGASWLEDVETDYSYPGFGPIGNEAETDVGFIIGGAAGTHLTEDIRVELEVAYSENEVDHFVFHDDDGTSDTYEGTGHFSFLTFMANVWYDIPLSEELKPYLGGGAGIAIVDANKVGYGEDENAPVYDSSEVAFAFQLGAGLRWAVSDNIMLDVGYRLKGIDGPRFDNVEDVVPNSSKYDADFIWIHNVIAGVSFGF